MLCRRLLRILGPCQWFLHCKDYFHGLDDLKNLPAGIAMEPSGISLIKSKCIDPPGNANMNANDNTTNGKTDTFLIIAVT